MIEDWDAVTGMLHHALIVNICFAYWRLQSQGTVNLRVAFTGLNRLLVLSRNHHQRGIALLTHGRMLDIGHRAAARATTVRPI